MYKYKSKQNRVGLLLQHCLLKLYNIKIKKKYSAKSVIFTKHRRKCYTLKCYFTMSNPYVCFVPMHKKIDIYDSEYEYGQHKKHLKAGSKNELIIYHFEITNDPLPHPTIPDNLINSNYLLHYSPVHSCNTGRKCYCFN